MNLQPTSFLSRLRSTYPGKPMAGILILWFFINAFFLWKNGIVTTGEAEKYIYQAQLYVTTGHFTTPNFWLYFIPVSLISLCLKFHLGFGWFVALQLFVNLAATLYFFRTALTFLGSQKIAFAGTLLLLLNLPYQAFNTFLQTESFFQSVSLLLSCYLISRQRFSARALATIFFTLLILSMTRPNGLLYWPAVLLYLFLCSLAKASPARKWSFGIVAAFLSFFLLNTAMSSGGELDFMLPFREEHIICGTPTLLYPANIHTTGTGNSIYALLYYITHNFGQFIRLAALKSVSFWGVYRSYYSTLHNGFLMVYFYSITLAALVAIPRWMKSYRLPALYLLSPVLLTWITVILTCDDWSNRIYLGISPYLLFVRLPVLFRRLEKPGRTKDASSQLYTSSSQPYPASPTDPFPPGPPDPSGPPGTPGTKPGD